jgi:N-ethylmaleimide reductase
MTAKKLLSPLITDPILFRNRVVMAPMNRRRAINGIPDASMITYYGQRTSAGLIITDNTAISSNGEAYLNTPGIYNDAQKQAWKKIVDEVHSEGGKIFIQLVHSGRVGHPLIQNEEPLIAPSAIKVNETIRIPDNSYQPMTAPVPIATDEIPFWINAFKQAAVNAMEVGFDGVEIHAAHGFLIDQFINPHSNIRIDNYGGSIENRSRFLVEVMQAVVAAIGSEKTGIRLSPFRKIYDLNAYPEEAATHQYIMDELQQLNILYVHFSNGDSAIPTDYLRDVRNRFKNLIILAGGLTVDSAEEILQTELADMVAFGKLYISNPDLVERIKHNASLAEWDELTFYQGGEKGYIDYPKIF